MADTDQVQLIQAARLHEYFHGAVHAAAERRHLSADNSTLHYLTLLLSQFARSERVFDYDHRGQHIRPLALLYGDALAAGNRRERCLWLQRLGDIALFVAGQFAGRLSRRFVDIDYCVAMGGNAYGYLGQTAAQTDEHAQALVFAELADSFEQFVEVVAVVTGRAPERLDA